MGYLVLVQEELAAEGQDFIFLQVTEGTGSAYPTESGSRFHLSVGCSLQYHARGPCGIGSTCLCLFGLAGRPFSMREAFLLGLASVLLSEGC